jgi:hypothetical protein
LTSQESDHDHLKFRGHLEETQGEPSFEYFNNPQVRALLHVSPDASPTYGLANFDVYLLYRPQIEASGWVHDILLGKYSQY